MIEAKQFNGLSQNDKIMEVASDVIASIEMKRLKVGRGTFVSFEQAIWDQHSAKDNLWSELPALMQSCECCALGACLLSLGRFREEFKPVVASFDPDFEGDTRTRLISSNFAVDYIAALFGMHMAQMIEVAFECGDGYWIVPKGEDEDREDEIRCVLGKASFEEAAAFGKQYADDDHRMKAIMANILQNKGEFVIPTVSAAESGLIVKSPEPSV